METLSADVEMLSPIGEILSLIWEMLSLIWEILSPNFGRHLEENSTLCSTTVVQCMVVHLFGDDRQRPNKRSLEFLKICNPKRPFFPKNEREISMVFQFSIFPTWDIHHPHTPRYFFLPPPPKVEKLVGKANGRRMFELAKVRLRNIAKNPTAKNT